MAQYPPPPQPDQQHYNALYPGSASTQQLLDQVQQDQLQYSNLTQPMFPKAESVGVGGDQSSNPHSIHRLAQEIQQHAAMEEQQRQQMQQASQQIHLSGSQPPQSNAHMTPVQAQAHDAALDQSQKGNRLRKACDSCSVRKVKCDESGPPCRACAALDIPCTFERPSRRRGPPNRHAEALKRRRLDEPGGGPLLPDMPSPSSPTHAAQALAALSSHAASLPLSAESLCPLEILNQLIDDFFTYVHPLYPFPHEPSFREAWKRREDMNNNRFLALLASMVGALIALFPRQLRMPVSKPTNLVNRCLHLSSLARGPGYLDGDNLNVYDAATSHFMGLAAVVTSKPRQGRLYYGECLTILRTLGLHRAAPNADGRLSGEASGELGIDDNLEHQTDNITIEIGRRIFWTMLVSIKSEQQIDASVGDLWVPPSTASEPYPPLPAQVDDFCIYPTHNEPQPDGLLPIVTGFNAIARVYESYTTLDTLEMTWGVDIVIDWEQQARVLHQSLKKCKDSLKKLAIDLTVDGLADSGGAGSTDLQNASRKDALPEDSSAPPIDPEQQGERVQSPEQRRQMQHGIQKAQVYASYLATRAYLVNKYWRLHDSPQRVHSTTQNGSYADAVQEVSVAALAVPSSPAAEAIEEEMKQEQEKIVRDLFIVLRSVTAVDMEPSANSFTTKLLHPVRTLLNIPKERKGPLALKSQDRLSRLLHILDALEHRPADDPDPNEPGDANRDPTAARLQPWLNLHDFQSELIQSDVFAENS